MPKRHKWRRSNGWTVCEGCAVRYRHGNFSREYEWADGMKSLKAGECASHGWKILTDDPLVQIYSQIEE